MDTNGIIRDLHYWFVCMYSGVLWYGGN